MISRHYDRMFYYTLKLLPGYGIIYTHAINVKPTLHMEAGAGIVRTYCEFELVRV